MQNKLYGSLFSEKTSNLQTLTPVIDYIKSSSPKTIAKELLWPSGKTKKIMDIKIISIKEIEDLKKLVLNDYSIKQKAALGILLKHADHSYVQEFLKKELQANPISYNNFNNCILQDKQGRKYRTKIYNIGPLSYCCYIFPKFLIKAAQEHPCRELDVSYHGLRLPETIAGRFVFSSLSDYYDFLPKKNNNESFNKEELRFFLENSCLSESEISDDFKHIGLYSSFAKLCFKKLPDKTILFLTDIVEKKTRDHLGKMKKKSAFKNTLVGKTFIGAGFAFDQDLRGKKWDHGHVWYGAAVFKP